MPRDNGHTLVAGRSRLKRRLRPILLLLGPVVLLCVAGYLYLASGRYVSTDDSYVRFNKVQISSDVAGRIVKVAVNENERVTKDQLLFALDDEPYRIALMRAEATLAARAQRRRGDARRLSPEGGERQGRRKRRPTISSTRPSASIGWPSRASRRNRSSRRRSAAPRWRASKPRRCSRSWRRRWPISAAISIFRSISSRACMQALAARDQAALDLRHTRILAPSDGIVANIDPRPGQYLTVGQAMCSLVEAGSLYIEANLKETELTHVKPGDEATVTVDTFPGRVWHARVTSIGAGTGSEFSILPAQNATGNWVKIEQRLPVRLHILPDEDVSALRAGMSVTVEIDTRHATALAGLFGGS